MTGYVVKMNAYVVILIAFKMKLPIFGIPIFEALIETTNFWYIQAPVRRHSIFFLYIFLLFYILIYYTIFREMVPDFRENIPVFREYHFPIFGNNIPFFGLKFGPGFRERLSQMITSFRAS